MTASTFIFVHDQYIVLDYLAAGKFNDLPEVKYVFLGMRPTDQIEHLVDMGKVIIARNLPDNIEHFPNLVAWTGWYALVRNDLIKTELVNLFEYDVNVVGRWVQSSETCGYFVWPSTDEVWWNYNGIQEEVEEWIATDRSKYHGTSMPMTSNYTLRQYDVNLFMQYTFPFVENPQAGHIMERCCSWFFEAYRIYTNRLTHLYADSHGTQGRGDRYQQIKSKLL